MRLIMKSKLEETVINVNGIVNVVSFRLYSLQTHMLSGLQLCGLF